MRIANIIEEAKLGGPQVRMVRVAAAMPEAETLIVMPTANSGQFQALCRETGVPYRALAMTRITKEWRVALGYLLFSPFEILGLVRLLKRERIDLVHASGGSWQYKAVIAARLAGVPSVWHLNDTAMPGWVRRLFGLFSPLPTGFIFASQRSRDYYGALLADRLQAVVPSTVDAAHFSPDAPRPGDADLLARLDGASVIGTVSNVNPVKGLETLIRAAARLRATVPGLRVVVVGAIHDNQKAYHASLVALAQSLGVADIIIWAGPRADVRPLLARFDTYVCCSNAESSPASVWEAMAMARPVVSTDVGDVGRHLTESESGFLVPVGDDAAMAERIKALLDDPTMRSRFGARAREAVIATFAPARIAATTFALYSRALAQGQSRRGRHARREGDET